MWQLQGFDSDDFIRNYWQKKPCLIRNAFPDFESPINPEELAGLACEEDVHCRLVIEKDGETPWQLRYGPFSEDDFLQLPPSHYSLLVSECEKWIPELSDLLDEFRFIPNWRIDDLMVSYAPEHGSVGPHVDEYDVFLLQALGQRRWQYCEQRNSDADLIPNLDLAILNHFSPDQDVVLNPGDMLYLPPGLAHHGVALERCMTYSIGFRAPTAAMVLESFALESDRLGFSAKRYADGDLEQNRHSAEITGREIDRFRSLIVELFERPDNLWVDSIGKLLSDSPAIQGPEQEQPVYISDLHTGEWIHHPETRMLYHAALDVVHFYCNGEAYQLPRNQVVIDALQLMCNHREWNDAIINQCLAVEALHPVLLDLATQGAILQIDDDQI